MHLKIKSYPIKSVYVFFIPKHSIYLGMLLRHLKCFVHPKNTFYKQIYGHIGRNKLLITGIPLIDPLTWNDEGNGENSNLCNARVSVFYYKG